MRMGGEENLELGSVKKFLAPSSNFQRQLQKESGSCLDYGHGEWSARMLSTVESGDCTRG